MENLLVIGSGGREHAIACSLADSQRVGTVYWMPGNGGASISSKLRAIPLLNLDEIVAFACDKNIALTVVGPEQYMAEGLVDRFAAAGLQIFGFTRQTAQLEWSKVFALQFARRHGIPIPNTRFFQDYDSARRYLSDHAGQSFFIKADELCGGKGAFFAPDQLAGEVALYRLFSEQICGKGEQVLIETAIIGEEISIMVITDGTEYRILPGVRDYKRLCNNNLGPNTGGMGAYAPVFLSNELVERITTRIIAPTFRGMVSEGLGGAGIVYFGVIVDRQNNPYLLEYNMRFGDPETQALLPLFSGDFYQLLSAACAGRLNEIELQWHSGATVCVVATTAGYPTKYGNDRFLIHGLDEAARQEGVKIFHAATTYHDGQWYGQGGRIFAITARQQTRAQARTLAYHVITEINFTDMYYRRDIATMEEKCVA
ncbi:phosphoribosylamine--glycine ligase [Candidatus Acetothermia bacterium]|jgi:phosphoribosylamine--glycine ligase|nr:phosphoribosylamine--glycine ligase [Candidatus Acetothermia bacterium]MCI2427833.1 phosphoribosylamine--glycine ligase [Candidatus Acetothermia bacterium]